MYFRPVHIFHHGKEHTQVFRQTLHFNSKFCLHSQPLQCFSSSIEPTMDTSKGFPVVVASKGHISSHPMTIQNWYKHVNWINCTGIVIFPFIGICLSFNTPLRQSTFAWAIIYYFFTGLGITAGYHRLWAHRAYSARIPLRLFLGAMGGGAVQGSIRWWSRGHRAHHRYTDTNADPYSVKKGLWYSHMGWMLFLSDPKQVGRADVSDLDEDPIVVWQHKNYGLVAITFGIVFPALIAALWGDWYGGMVYAGFLRFFFVQQATFCVNSLAHWIGEQPFDDRRSPRDHMLTALVTLGEGYHNFHHEFPSDYSKSNSHLSCHYFLALFVSCRGRHY